MKPGKRVILVTAGEVCAGDVVRLPRGGEHVVLRVEGPYDDGTLVIVYRAFDRWAWGRSGTQITSGLFERSLRPVMPRELVQLADRGRLDLLDEHDDVDAADRDRAEMATIVLDRDRADRGDA